MTTNQRDEILVAALAVFAERGFRGASFDAVAERAGLTRQGVLHYFPSKKQLLVGILRYREELNRANLADRHADEDWPTQVAAVLSFDHDNPALVQAQSVLLAESVTYGDPIHDYFLDRNRRSLDAMAARLSERYGDRLPSGLTPRAAAAALLAILDGMQQQWSIDPDLTGHPEIIHDVMAVLLGKPVE